MFEFLFYARAAWFALAEVEGGVYCCLGVSEEEQGVVVLVGEEGLD